MPALLILDESGRLGRCRRAPERPGGPSTPRPSSAAAASSSAAAASRRTHALHAWVYHLRWPLLAVLLALVVAMLPLALELLGTRSGGDFGFFGEFATPPPEGVAWRGPAYDFARRELSRTQLAGDAGRAVPSLYRQLLSDAPGGGYALPALTLPLWPFGGFLAALLVLDALLALLTAYVTHSARRHCGLLRRPLLLQRAGRRGRRLVVLQLVDKAVRPVGGPHPICLPAPSEGSGRPSAPQSTA